MKKMFLYFSLSPFLLFAQDATVRLDWATELTVGNTSTLDRKKYFNMHETFTSNSLEDGQKLNLINNYGLSFGRGIGGFRWHMKTDNIQQDGNKGLIDVSKMIAKGQESRNRLNNKTYLREHSFDQIVSAHNTTFMPNDDVLQGFDPQDMDAVADFAAHYFKHYYEDYNRPKYFEPTNEPLSHRDFTIDGRGMEIEDVANLHNIVAARVRELNPDVKVGGFASAWPAFENWNFSHWNDRFKTFIDIAGENMDFYSIHIYDGKNVGALTKSQRSGSNAEAILDLLRCYSFSKHGTVKPLIISEYGRTQPDYQQNSYTPERDGEIINSINQILFGFMNRPDTITQSIPFIVGKSEYFINGTGRTYPWVIYRPNDLENLSAGWQFSHLVKFYNLWKNVSGNRLKCTSSDPDVQVQLYSDRNKAYLCLNNVDNTVTNIDLSRIGETIPNISGVFERKLYCEAGKAPLLQQGRITNLPTDLVLRENETIIYEIDFATPHEPTKDVKRITYYHGNTVRSIQNNTAINYNFPAMRTAISSARIRFGVSRKHNRSPLPTKITVNGETIPTPTDWAGGDQGERDQFFGSIEAPFDHNLLRRTGENVVSLTFAQNDGQVSTVIIETETAPSSSDPDPTSGAFNGTAHPIPGTIQAEHYDIGENGSAYYDTTLGNAGPSTLRNPTDVDLVNAPRGNIAIGYTNQSEWWKYSCNISPDTYDIVVKYSKLSAPSARLLLSLSDTTLGFIDLPSTNGWNNYDTQTLENVSLSGASLQTLTLLAETVGNFNLDSITFIPRNFETWIQRTARSGTSGDALQFANDYNQNGIPNGIEYILPSSSSSPQADLPVVHNGALEFNLGKPLPDDITVHLEKSRSLESGSWNSIRIHDERAIRWNGTDLELIDRETHYGVRFDLGEHTQERQFFRVRAEPIR